MDLRIDPSSEVTQKEDSTTTRGQSETFWFNLDLASPPRSVLSPLTESLVEIFLNNACKDAMKILCPSFHHDSTLIRLRYGRAFINISCLEQLAIRRFSISSSGIFYLLKGESRIAAEAPLLTTKYLLLNLRLLTGVPREIIGLRDALKERLDEYSIIRREVFERPVSDWDPEAFLSKLQRLFNSLRSSLVLYLVITGEMLLNYLYLLETYRRWIRYPETEDILLGLIDSSPGLAELEQNRTLWKLGQETSSDPAVQAWVSQGNAELSNAPKNVKETEFWMRLHDFLAKFGHHGPGHADLANPRWNDNLPGLLEVIWRFKDSPDPRRDVMAQNKANNTSYSPNNRIFRNWSNFLLLFKRIFFRQILIRTGVINSLWKESKDHLLLQLDACRFLYLELGRKLVRNGVLDLEEDIFQLKAHEIEDLLSGKPREYLRELIKARRSRNEQLESLVVPSQITSTFQPANPHLNTQR